MPASLNNEGHACCSATVSNKWSVESRLSTVTLTKCGKTVFKCQKLGNGENGKAQNLNIRLYKRVSQACPFGMCVTLCTLC
jgi:hypothetical protein